ncbi:MAG: J domain-containing protein [Syntrophotaleaceae bacterium]
MSALISEDEIIKACRTIFGPDITLSREFLAYLQPSGVKSAYRQKVKETHPDSFGGRDIGQQQEQTKLFQDLLAAYETVSGFFKQRESGLWVASTDQVRESRAPRPAENPGHSSPRNDPPKGSYSSSFSSESLPSRQLEIGLFLYYQGIITYRQLIDALIWQRRQRPNLGDIAQRWGWLTEKDVKAILCHRGIMGRFGQKALRLKYLTDRQLNTLLFFQRSRQKKLGQYFVEKEILLAEEIERLVQEQKNHNSRAALERFRRGFPR